MKNLFKSLMLVAVAAMGFTACSKESFADVTPEVENVVKMTITADGEAVRTYLDEANDVAKWNESGEYIRVYQLIDDAENASFVKSSEGVVNGNVATFGASFAAAEGTSFTYSAIYPASAGADNDGAEDLGYVKLILSDSQKPSTTSFDAAADLMIAKTIVEEAQVTELSLQFKRVVAVAKMSLTNLDTADKLVNVTFEATNKVLAGRSAFDVTTGDVVEYGYNSPTSKISLMYSDAIAKNTPIYFTCFPTELAAGDSFTVTATTENGTKYTRTVTLAGEQALNFKEGKMSTFSVNMATADKEVVASLAGEYAIMAKADGALQIMGNQTNSYLTRTTVVGSEIPSEYKADDEQYIWVVEKVNSNYTIKQKSSGKYVSWSSGNSATLATDPYELTIEENNDDDRSVTIKSVADPTRKLQYNAGSPRFAFYTSGQTAISLVPATINTNPVISVANTAVSIVAAGVENQTIAVTCKNFDAADLTVTKAAGADWLTVSYDDAGTITYSASENEVEEERSATVTLSADGADDVVITFTQAAPSTGGGEPVTVTYTISTLGYSNGTSVDGATLYLDSSKLVTAVFNKANSGTKPAYYSGAIRMYQNGATLDITAGGKTITEIVLTFASNQYYIGADCGTLSAASATRTWTGESTAIKFTSTGTSSSTRAYVSSIKVTYID